MRLPPHREMRPDSTALHAEQFRVPHKKPERSLDFLDGTPECAQEHCHNLEGPGGYRNISKVLNVP